MADENRFIGRGEQRERAKERERNLAQAALLSLSFFFLLFFQSVPLLSFSRCFQTPLAPIPP